MPPLDGIRVLDFSTLLPGPMASLLLAEAGADVIKIERPGSGDEMRLYEGRFGDTSANFAMLNRGKRSISLDLKAPSGRDQAKALADKADIVIEQFRPGVMARLGLGFDDLKAINPRLIYCSITGYGQSGPQADKAAHDLNYLAESGLLGLCVQKDGAPSLPPILAADIAGGAYPAVMNILLALRQRDQTGQGQHLDVAMADNLFTFGYWGMGAGFAEGKWPTPGGDLVTGGSARYQIHRTKDNRYLAAAPLEDRFWSLFCDALELPPDARNDAADPGKATLIVAERIASRDAAEWERIFKGRDCCVSIVASLKEAVESPAFQARRILERKVATPDGRTMPALPVPLDQGLRNSAVSAGYPELAEPGQAITWKLKDPTP